jgi:NTP pyrophosphatase (non-canonical NTP hydrolase)
VVQTEDVTILGGTIRSVTLFILGWGIDMTRKQIYEKALTAWGRTFQMDMLVEECAELIHAIQKYKRCPTVDNVIEELADVEIMCEQMRLIFNPAEIDRIKEQKTEAIRSTFF